MASSKTKAETIAANLQSVSDLTEEVLLSVKANTSGRVVIPHLKVSSSAVF
jgi:hypothetical protein